MSFVRANPGGWSVGAQLTSAQQNALDIDHANALDKTVAGDSIAGTVHVASGASLTFDSGSTLTGTVSNGTLQIAGSFQIAAQVASAIAAGTANAIVTGVASGITSNIAGGIASTVVGGISLAGGVNDWPTFSLTRSKHYAFPPRTLDPSVIAPFGTSTATAKWNVGLFAQGVSGTASAIQAIPLAIETPHQGATLSSITVVFAVGQAHGSPPFVGPSLQVYRYPLTAGATLTFQSLAATAQQFATVPGTGAAWYNGGLVQTFLYVCNQNHVIDVTSFTYQMLLADENGSGALGGNNYIGFIANYTGVPNLQFST